MSIKPLARRIVISTDQPVEIFASFEVSAPFHTKISSPKIKLADSGAYFYDFSKNQNSCVGNSRSILVSVSQNRNPKRSAHARKHPGFIFGEENHVFPRFWPRQIMFWSPVESYLVSNRENLENTLRNL